MLKRRLRIKTEELRLINEILKGIVKYGGDVERTFDHVLRTFYSFWNVEHSFIALFDPKLGELKVTNSFGFLPDEVERAIYSSGEGIVGQTYKLGIPLFATEDELLNKTGLLDRLKHKNLSLFTAPIKSGNRILGVIAIFKEAEDKGKSIEKTLETLSIVGSILGTFIHLRENWEKKKETPAQPEGVLGEGEVAKYGLLGVSEAVQQLRDLVRRVARTDLPVLVAGPDGSGKTLIAHTIHILSDRREGPLVVLDLRNVPRTLIEEELFGTPQKEGLIKKAEGGTLIIKHIELLPPEVQKRLLEYLQKNQAKMPIRLVATTSENLPQLVKRGDFLGALYELLSLVEVKVPPLKERMEDVPILVRHILKKYNKRYGKNVKLDEEVVRFLTTADLKENVKELDRLIHRLVILSSPEGEVGLASLRLIAPAIFKRRRETIAEAEGEDLPLPQKIEEEEKKKIVWALEQTNYVKSRAAKLLGYTLRQLDYRIKKYGIEVKRRKES